MKRRSLMVNTGDISPETTVSKHNILIINSLFINKTKLKEP